MFFTFFPQFFPDIFSTARNVFYFFPTIFSMYFLRRSLHMGTTSWHAALFTIFTQFFSNISKRLFVTSSIGRGMVGGSFYFSILLDGGQQPTLYLVHRNFLRCFSTLLECCIICVEKKPNAISLHFLLTTTNSQLQVNQQYSKEAMNKLHAHYASLFTSSLLVATTKTQQRFILDMISICLTDKHKGELE